MSTRYPRALARMRLLPVVLLATGGCLATRVDVQRLELQVRSVESAAAVRQARSDSATQALVREIGQTITQQFSRQLAQVSDSVRQLAAALQRLQGDVQLAMHDVKGQLTTLQEGLGQSARRLQDLRSSVEASAGAQPPRQMDSTAAAGATAGIPAAPTLFQTARTQLSRNALSSARANFQLLIDQYPTYDRVSDAQLEIGKIFAADGERAAADSVYALVVQKYPNSDAAPTALYKRAMLAKDLKDSARAKALFEQIVVKYPKSTERSLADDFLSALRKP